VLPPSGSHPLPAPEPSDGRGALLKDIVRGTQLKPVIMQYFIYMQETDRNSFLYRI